MNTFWTLFTRFSIIFMPQKQKQDWKNVWCWFYEQYNSLFWHFHAAEKKNTGGWKKKHAKNSPPLTLQSIVNRRIAEKWQMNNLACFHHCSFASCLTYEKSQTITAENVLLIKGLTDGFFSRLLFALASDVDLWIKNCSFILLQCQTM